MAPSIQVWMPYFASTMAIVMAIFVAAWLHNKHIDLLAAQFNARVGETNHRIDQTNRRIDEVLAILRDVQKSLQDLDRRVTRLEERWAPLMRP